MSQGGNRDSSRRRFLLGAGAAVGVGAAGAYFASRQASAKPVVVAKAEAYDGKLEDIVRRGLETLGWGPPRVKGKRVLLKPNLVEPTREAPHINTHPLFVQAVAAVFRKWDAKEVFVAEGQGHIRDTALVLEQSGLAPILKDLGLDFVDLNHDEIFTRRNPLGATGMPELSLPVTLERADIFVSLPKLKLHHWAGATLSMKNLFGVMPGICYGWPKNLLHQLGIPSSILDINATVKPDLAIIDGIIGMEGDGPIMGTPKQSNLIVMGENFVAVDATACRLMGLDPMLIPYLSPVEARSLGPVDASLIAQRGEPIAGLVQRFEYPSHKHFESFRKRRPNRSANDAL
ncbi:MAG TPA: DUF362 domain-containing protein [Planctomycetia bacterium]|nr:DUF362 domain-containing protein [Planctomycetia bacterium]